MNKRNQPGAARAIERATARRYAARIAELEARQTETERRLENTVRHGPVTDVDPKKQVCRLMIGRDADGTPQKSPWVPYAQHAGMLKIHAPPTVGQNMTMVAMSGDLEQALALPFTWNNANKAPGTDATHVLTFGDKITMQMSDGKLIVTIPDTTFRVDDDHSWNLTKDGHKLVGAVQNAPSKDATFQKIDHSHVHTGVIPGDALTGEPQ